MDWAGIIERKRGALLAVVAALFALAGLEENAPATLPRHLLHCLQRILRPAETATRRLIVIAAHSLAKIHAPFGAFLYGLDVSKALGRRPAANGATDDAQARIPAFALADPVKHFSAEPFRGRPRSVPRILFLDGPPPPPLPPVPTPDDPLDARTLCRRLQALKRALDDIDAQARRLARWQARRERAFSCPTRLSPMRNGRPPGLRKRRQHEVDILLADLHALALFAIAADTS